MFIPFLPFLLTKMNIIKNNEIYFFLFYFLLFIDHWIYDLSLYLSSKQMMKSK